MIPLSLVTGFLGAGKTTLLQRIARARGGRRCLFLVNEFAPGDVDGRKLAEVEAGGAGRVESIVGGSVFCVCKVSDFAEALGRAAETWADADPPLDGVIVEASGIADPRVVGRMLAETELDERFELRRVITVVDPGTFGKLLRTLPNIRAQVEAADLVLLNKTDLYDEPTIESTIAAVREVRPEATIVPTSHCGAVVDPFEPVEVARADGDYAYCADPNYYALDVPVEAAFDRDALSRCIDAHADSLYRLKGNVRLDEGTPARLELAAGGLTVEPLDHAPAAFHVTLIGPGSAKQTIDHLAAALREGRTP